ncbi:Alpha/Beta hydrolase protein [Lyophyllum atratum]|nr:Alpha/Beta hydrolase protein [Lyophyllum atratum]
MLQILPTALRTLIVSLLWSSQADIAPAPLKFQLRHEHGVTNASHTIFADTPRSFAAETYEVSTMTTRASRPESHTAFSNARSRSMRHMQSEPLKWTDEEVAGPDIKKRDTLVQLAKMTYNSYSVPKDNDWYDLGPSWNTSFPFGWEPDADGFRGHIFVSEDNSTVVVTVKGTSAPWLAGGGGPTVKKDKLNDNLLFSCCCARVGPTWSPVCDCYSGGYRCDQTCVERSLVEDSLFYPIGINLYNNVTYMYPDANIWMVGHSLGGGLASLIGVTFGVPVVAFEAPGERSASKRLHLPSPPSTQHVTHVYHTGDPIPMGACTGVTSACAIGGYALETSCHLGKSIRYDTVSKRNWSVSASYHPIKFVIEKVLNEDWDPENGLEVPPAEEEKDCVDCYSWEYGEFKNVTRTRRRFPLSP